MKVKITIIVVLFFWVVGKAQDIENITYTDKDNKEVPAFSFSLPVCNKETVLSVWKNFIKKQGGKARGGVINKLNGVNLKFDPKGDLWNGILVYEYVGDKNMNIFTSFQDSEGIYINDKSSERSLALPVLNDFKNNMNLTCTQQDLVGAKNYNLSLEKERIRNTDRILFLEKGIQQTNNRIEVLNSQTSDIDEAKVSKLKEDIQNYQKEISQLKEQNLSLEKEIEAQKIVIQHFQDRLDGLEGNGNNIDPKILSNEWDQKESINDNSNNSLNDSQSTEKLDNIDQVESLDDSLELDFNQ